MDRSGADGASCKWWLLLFGLGLAAGLWPGSAPGSSPGGETPTLVDTLHEKGILTAEEYAALEERESRLDRVLGLLGGLQVGALTYLDFSYGEHTRRRVVYFAGGPVVDERYDAVSRFTVTRGYINIRKDLTGWLGFRATPDAYQDDAGAFKLRMKYLYADLRPPDVLFLTGMRSEVGIGHMPWLVFEEQINPYRSQGTMFLERAGLFNSADLGVSLQGYFGGPLWQSLGPWPGSPSGGRWGSWHVGVYNGSGYLDEEQNNNKVPEFRVTLRPLPDLLPGLQVTYFGLIGEGNRINVTDWPRYEVHLVMLSYESPWVVFTGQYARAVGNSAGTLVVPGTDQALRSQGFSLFLNVAVPGILDRSLNLFGRYDSFDPDIEDWVTASDDGYQLAIGGLAWDFMTGCHLLIAYERILYGANNGGLGEVPVARRNLQDDWKIQTVLQIAF